VTPPFRLTDSTLRDGSHAVAHQYTRTQVTDIVAGLDAAGVPVIEVSHGDGLGGSSFNYGFSGTDEMKLINAAVATAQRARIACLLLPGIGTAEDLKAVADAGVSVARVATHCTEADIAEQHIGMAKRLGMEAVGFLMMSHMLAPEELLAQARLMQESGADVVYCVDSAGALTVPEARDRITALVQGLRAGVGMHAHENLSLSVAISLAALEADPKVDIVPLSESLYARAIQRYRERPDKEWGLTDCVSFLVMQDRGRTEALTTDEHFQQAGFRALLREESS